ncbi:MAG: hypothetical protein ABH872_00665 [Candidatus Omnitrophota bacterium]
MMKKAQGALIAMFVIAFLIAVVFTLVDRAKGKFAEYNEKQDKKIAEKSIEAPKLGRLNKY